MASDYISSEHDEDFNNVSLGEIRSEVKNNLEDDTQLTKDMEEEISVKGKREREIDSTEVWTQYHRNSKKKATRRESSKPSQSTYQICVTCKDKLPKQFTLAKLLKKHDIAVSRVKYVNQFKLLFTFEDEMSAEKFLLCNEFKELGWNRQKTWEVGVSYGIIKNIELELSEKDLLEVIYSTVDIVSAKRLSRRNDQGWTPSETMRLGFYGPQIPSHVYLFELSIKVDPYVFPVTQCSRCWRFGHMVKMCPSIKIICPKCGGHHANCDTNSFKCVNCSGKHISLDKACPVYVREKRIRELMSEYSCTYQKALEMYVPPSPMPYLHDTFMNQEEFPLFGNHGQERGGKREESGHVYTGVYSSTYAEMASENPYQQIPKKPKRTKMKKQKMYLNRNTYAEIEVSEGEDDNDHITNFSGSDFEEMESKGEEKTKLEQESDRDNNDQVPTFQELLDKLKNVIFRKRLSISEKIKSVVRAFLDWTVIFVVKHLADLPLVKNFVSILTTNG